MLDILIIRTILDINITHTAPARTSDLQSKSISIVQYGHISQAEAFNDLFLSTSIALYLSYFLYE